MKHYGLEDLKTLDVVHMMFYYWLGRFGISERIRIVTDKRLKHHMSTEFFVDGTIELRINLQNIKKDWDLAVLVSGILHEIGHILSGLPYVTDEDIIYDEFRAETFALSILAYFYPKFYKRAIKYYRYYLYAPEVEFEKKYPLHWKAFTQIREYQKKRKDK